MQRKFGKRLQHSTVYGVNIFDSKIDLIYQHCFPAKLNSKKKNTFCILHFYMSAKVKGKKKKHFIPL